MSAPGVYHGSCHCGAIQYQIKLSFPASTDPAAKSIKLYKCNCTICQKSGIFHCRPISPEDDFIVTSPTTLEEMGCYRVFTKNIGWYFCKECGVRTFACAGKFEQIDLDLDKWAGKESKGETKKVWVMRVNGTFTFKKDGKDISVPLLYVSVNAVTLEPGEGGVDLVDWHDKGWIYYVENREAVDFPDQRGGKPFVGGMY